MYKEMVIFINNHVNYKAILDNENYRSIYFDCKLIYIKIILHLFTILWYIIIIFSYRAN